MPERPVSTEAMLLSCAVQQEDSDQFDSLLYLQANRAKLRLLTVNSTFREFGSVVLVPR